MVDAIVPQIANHLARLNITYAGQNGDFPDPVPYDSSDDAIKQMAVEGLRQGYVPGIGAIPDANLTDFVVERFLATAEVPYQRIMVRPKTPFGRARPRCRCGYALPKGAQQGDLCPNCDEPV